MIDMSFVAKTLAPVSHCAGTMIVLTDGRTIAFPDYDLLLILLIPNFKLHVFFQIFCLLS